MVIFSGYYVTFTSSGNSAGYILFSLMSGEDPIVEFAFEGNGPLDTKKTPIKKMPSIENNSNGNQKILYTGPGEIFVPLETNTFYSVYDHEDISKSSAMLASGDVNIYDGIIKWDDANINTNSVKKITSFGSGSDYWLMTDFSSGGVCTPTAATNVLWYWGYERNCSNVMNKVSAYSTNKSKAIAIFKILYNAMGTNVTTGTKDYKILDGYKSFFGVSAGTGTWNYKSIPASSNYSSYTKELDNDCPIHLVLHTKNSVLDKGEGHCVMNFGYAQSNTGVKYLFVMDGWYRYGRFVKFNYYPYFFGYKIWVA